MNRLVIAALIVAALRPAHADPMAAWTEGVPRPAQDQANALFDEGNQLFAQQAHGPALEKYRAAVAIWDHPMIRYNMAVTEVRLDRILDASRDLEQALRFGSTPFTPDLYQQAVDYQTLLKGQIGDLEVSCVQADVQIALDGKPWFSCPGQRRVRVTTGEHAIVGDRSGFVTSSSRVVVAGGAVVLRPITLVSLEAASVLEYPHARWIPWTVTAGGAAIVLGGLGYYLSGKNQMDAFHGDFAISCATGCEADLSQHPLLRRERDGAILKGEIGVSVVIAGGAVTVAGVVFAILNRPTRKLPRIEAGPTAGGATAAVRWEF